MKKLITLSYLIVIFFISCVDSTPTPTPGNMYIEKLKDTKDAKLRYFMDDKINKCFVERGSGQTYAFTCVPCDSLFYQAMKNQK